MSYSLSISYKFCQIDSLTLELLPLIMVQCLFTVCDELQISQRYCIYSAVHWVHRNDHVISESFYKGTILQMGNRYVMEMVVFL